VGGTGALGRAGPGGDKMGAQHAQLRRQGSRHVQLLGYRVVRRGLLRRASQTVEGCKRERERESPSSDEEGRKGDGNMSEGDVPGSRAWSGRCEPLSANFRGSTRIKIPIPLALFTLLADCDAEGNVASRKHKVVRRNINTGIQANHGLGEGRE